MWDCGNPEKGVISYLNTPLDGRYNGEGSLYGQGLTTLPRFFLVCFVKTNPVDFEFCTSHDVFLQPRWHKKLCSGFPSDLNIYFFALFKPTYRKAVLFRRNNSEVPFYIYPTPAELSLNKPCTFLQDQKCIPSLYSV